MNAIVTPSATPHASRAQSTPQSFAANALNLSARAWFTVAVTGQLVFVFYLLAFYVPTASQGNLVAWNRVAPHAYVAGDILGNTMFAAHILLAVLIVIAGASQLIPQIRARVPAVHRWTGRAYLLAVVTTSVAGLYLVWVRGSVGDLSQHLGSTLNAILIIVFAALALREARARRFIAHRRWAMRVFVVGLGVWFFRLSLPLWLMIHRAPVGFDPKTFTGPFLTFLSFACYLVPLLVLELYLRAQESSDAMKRGAMAGVMGVVTLATVAGVAGATMMLWWPRM